MNDFQSRAAQCVSEILVGVDTILLDQEAHDYLKASKEYLRSQLSMQQAMPFPQTQSAAVKTKAEYETVLALLELVECRRRNIESVAGELRSQGKLTELFRRMGVRP